MDAANGQRPIVPTVLENDFHHACDVIFFIAAYIPAAAFAFDVDGRDAIL